MVASGTGSYRAPTYTTCLQYILSELVVAGGDGRHTMTAPLLAESNRRTGMELDRSADRIRVAQPTRSRVASHKRLKTTTIPTILTDSAVHPRVRSLAASTTTARELYEKMAGAYPASQHGWAPLSSARASQAVESGKSFPSGSVCEITRSSSLPLSRTWG